MKLKSQIKRNDLFRSSYRRKELQYNMWLYQKEDHIIRKVEHGWITKEDEIKLMKLKGDKNDRRV